MKEVSAAGHAGYAKKGGDIVCAGVTTLLRSAAKVLYGNENVTVSGIAPAEGILRFGVSDIPGSEFLWVKGITDVLIQGLSDLCSEFPDKMRIEIKE
ncbi:MAG: ribosomal-processing cysteine protease Prp [Spirochaetales bacterium]|nr:ribosomal-processing cysteine protease Prp [Spirochaetales bacterium]